MKPLALAALFATLALTSSSALASLDLAKKNGCAACHAVDKKILGPAFREIGKRYAGDKTAEARLMERISKGSQATGGQKWGTIPMAAMPAVKDEERRALVRWILSGAK